MKISFADKLRRAHRVILLENLNACGFAEVLAPASPRGLVLVTLYYLFLVSHGGHFDCYSGFVMYDPTVADPLRTLPVPKFFQSLTRVPMIYSP